MTEAIQKSLRESPLARWTALFFLSLSMFGAYYFNYAGSAVKPVLEIALGWNSKDLGLYTGSYAIFNVFLFMLIFSGFILDKLGVRITGLAATLMMAIGTALNYWAMTSMPVHFASKLVALPFYGHTTVQVLMSSLGFGIFGIGSEATGITLSKGIVRWFKGKELALAMGLQMSLARLGTALAFFVSLPLAIKFTYSTPILLAFVLMLVGLVSFIAYIILDKRLDASEKDMVFEEEEPFRIKDILSIIDIKAFWYLTLLCVLFYGAVFPFLFYAPDFIINKYHVSPYYAGFIPALLPFGTIFLTPVFGYIYDKKGKGATIMIIGAVIAAAMILILGTAFSLVPAAMWASVPKFIPERKLGTAYAVIFWIQNVGLFFLPILIGAVLHSTNPDVSPNKALIKSSIEQSFNKVLAEKGVTYNAKTLAKAIDKTTGKVVDSIVQNTRYIPTPQKDVNTEQLKNKIIQDDINSAAGFTLVKADQASLEALGNRFVKSTYPLIKDQKLNITYNYQNVIYIFVILGILSVIVSFLLKAEDKKKGYGLELPNMEK